MQPRLDRAQQVLWENQLAALQQPLPLAGGTGLRAGRDAASQAQQTKATLNNLLAPPPPEGDALGHLRERTPLRPHGSAAEPMLPASAQMPQGRDGRLLADVLAEMRALRAEINQLSRMLGITSRDSNRVAYKGILQQRDLLDSDVRYEHFLDEDALKQANLAAQLRRSEVLRITAKQQELIYALQLAEQRLAAMPEKLPPGLRDAVSGGISQARYSTAQFGGTQIVTLLSGMQFTAAA